MLINIEEFNNKLYITKCVNDSIKHEIVSNYKPSVFFEADDGKYKLLKSSKKIKSIKLNDINSFYNYLNNNSQTLYNSNIKPKYQYISDFFYQKENESIKLNHTFISVLLKGKTKHIEIKKATNEIRTIQIFEMNTNNIFIFGIKELNINYTYKNHNINYIKYDNEILLLNGFIEFIKKQNPITLIGWFEDVNELQYIIDRCKFLNIDYKNLSPFNIIKKRKLKINNVDNYIEEPIGRYFFNFKDIYDFFSKGSMSSNKLEFISKIELDLKEIIDKDLINLDDLYENNYNLFINYGIQNVVLLNTLNEKLGFIFIMIEQAIDMGVNFNDIFSTINPWTHKIYNELIKLNYVLPNLNNNVKKEYQGPYILHPEKGLYSNIIELDIESEYPNAIRANNISYETILEDDDLKLKENYLEIKTLQDTLRSNNAEEYLMNLGSDELKKIIKLLNKNNIIMSPAGEFYSKDKEGFIPNLISKIFDERKIAQEKYFDYSNILEICERL